MILESGGFSYLEERLLRLRIRQADVKKMIVDAESGNFKTVENALALEILLIEKVLGVIRDSQFKRCDVVKPAPHEEENTRGWARFRN